MEERGKREDGKTEVMGGKAENGQGEKKKSE